METRSNYVMVGAVTVALLIGTLLFIVWLAGLSSKTTKCYDIYFPAVGGIDKGSNVSFSGVPVGQVSKISLLPNRPEFVWVRIERRPADAGARRHDRGDPQRQPRRRQRNPAEWRRARAAADHPDGPAGLPSHPCELRAASVLCSTARPNCSHASSG